jgi:hypothetical protein
LLRWGRKKAALMSGVDAQTIYRFEMEKSSRASKDKQEMQPENLLRLFVAFWGAGVEFGEKGWIRLKPDDSEMQSKPQSEDRDQR